MDTYGNKEVLTLLRRNLISIACSAQPFINISTIYTNINALCNSIMQWHLLQQDLFPVFLQEFPHHLIGCGSECQLLHNEGEVLSLDHMVLERRIQQPECKLSSLG